MAAAKKQTKKDLEDKIAQLEAKLSKLSTQLDTKPAETKPAETTTKPKGTLPKGFGDKPAAQKEAPKPAETTTKPKGTLPKGFGDKPAAQKEAPKPKEEQPPKPAETTTQLPATVQEALEDAYRNAPTTDFHQYRAKVTGYSPAPHRYFVRKTAPVGKVPTSNWNDQKATVTGYTQASNQYFATRARLAYHPPDKTFGSFSGVNMTVEGVTAKAQETSPPPTPAKGTLPKGMEQPQTQQAPPPSTQQQTTYDSNKGASRKEILEQYEKDYLQRIEQEKIAQEKTNQEALEAEVKTNSQKTRGSLPKGFESQAEPEPPKPSRGTLPKGF